MGRGWATALTLKPLSSSRYYARANLQFRAEMFNIFNQVNFSNPNTTVTGGGFGTITSTFSAGGDPRIIQFGLKLGFDHRPGGRPKVMMFEPTASVTNCSPSTA